ncbi:MAG: beta-lactamase family protein [Clostridia bacterium]|nr:beta-lactamase family protein [Clostridia bacterium]
MINLNKTIDELIGSGTVQHIVVRVGRKGEVIHDAFRNACEASLFDMASVTKIMATTSLAMIAIDRGLLQLNDAVDKFYPTDKPLTIKNLLTHTIGIGHKSLKCEGNSYDNIAEKILAIQTDIPIGTDVLYSCPGFILLGKILEKVFEKQLDQCFEEMVAEPLGLENTLFLPKNRKDVVNSNLDEEKRGTVNDYNCQFLGGVAGNAGLFSTLSDITKYVQLIQNRGKPLFGEETFLSAVRNYTAGMSGSRGLGFLYVDDRYKQAGGLFSKGAIGHCGHTGQSVFVDYRSGLYVIILSDATISTVKKYGKERYDEVMDMRARLHAAIKRDLQELSVDL